MKKNPQTQQLKKDYLQLLKEFIAIKTVSTDSSFKKDIEKAVAWLSKLFKVYGFTVSHLKGKSSNPVVVAKYIVDKKAKTVLVYGHYDVQPADKKDGWKTDPFILTKKKDRYFARGAVDNKGQILAHMVSVFDAIKRKQLKHNIIFLIEGNEESGNPDLAGLLEKNKKKLDCDLVLISDGEMVGLHPTLDISFRGGGNMKVVYQTSENDRHSGLFGGAIPNAALELANTLSGLKKNNIVTVEGFYDGIECVSEDIVAEHKLICGLQPIAELAGVKALLTEPGIDECSQIGLRPTLEVSGVCSGYTGTGYKNIVPGRAEARINVRTVHSQKSVKVLESIKKHILKNTPDYVSAFIELESHGNPIKLESDHEHVMDIKKLLVDVHGKRVIHKAGGGSIPVVGEMKEILQKPMALVSLCNDDCNMHGVDENFTEHHIDKALEFSSRFWKGL